MDNLIILFLVLVVMAVLAFASRKESSFQKGEVLIYQYSKGIKWIMAGASIFFPLFLLWAFIFERLETVSDVVALSICTIGSVLTYYFFFDTRIYLTDKTIEKKTPYWSTRIPYKEITKIIIYRSPANPGAAMTRVHGKKKITLEALLVDYDELVDELLSQCKHAEIIEK